MTHFRQNSEIFHPGIQFTFAIDQEFDDDYISELTSSHLLRSKPIKFTNNPKCSGKSKNQEGILIPKSVLKVIKLCAKLEKLTFLGLRGVNKFVVMDW